jgi:hypothetical protein
VGPLCDDAVIRRIRRNFVPVAVNLHETLGRRDEAGAFLRLLRKGLPRQYQGLYVVTAEGKVLAGQGEEPRPGQSWTPLVLDALDAGLRAFGPVTRRKAKRVDPFPHRGVGVRADGSVTPAVYVTYLQADGKPRDRLTLDSATLPAAEWAKLAPPKVAAGVRWEVPAAVARRFCRVLSPQTDQSTLARPEEVTAVGLTGKVVHRAGDLAYLRYEGHIASVRKFPFEPKTTKTNRARVTFTGVGTCAVKTGRLESFLLVGDGVYHHWGPGEAEKYAAVVEWRRRR